MFVVAAGCSRICEAEEPLMLEIAAGLPSATATLPPSTYAFGVARQRQADVAKITTWLVAKATAHFAGMSETPHQAQDGLGRSLEGDYDVFAHSNWPPRVRYGERLRRPWRRWSSRTCRGFCTKPRSSWATRTHSHERW